MKLKKIFQLIILSLLLANLAMAYNLQPAYAQTPAPAHAQKYHGVQQQITDFLCTPTDAAKDPEAAKGDLYNCINKIYRFALVLASVFAVFFIVIGGFIYISAEGNQESVDKAKSILLSSITSLVILFGGYVLLKYLNPDLIKFQPIQPPSVVGKERAYSFENVAAGQLAALFGAELNNRDTSKTIGKTYIGTKNFPPQGSTPIAIARSQLGAREDCCDTSGEGLNKGKEINKYFTPNGGQGQPWCAYFTSWTYGQAGYVTIGNASGRGGSLNFSNFLKGKNNQVITDGGKKYKIQYFTKQDLSQGKATPKAGDIAFFNRGKVGGGNGHSAIVENYDSSSKTINTIDGNVDNSVSQRSRNIDVVCDKDGENGVCDFVGFARVVNQ